MPGGSGISPAGVAVISAGVLASVWVLLTKKYLLVKPGVLQLTGAGAVSSEPDTGKVSFTATGRSATAADAREKAAATAAAAVEALMAVDGIDKKDLTTESFNVGEEQEWDGQKQKNVHLGYKAENGFSLTVHNMSEERLADVIDAAVNAGKEALAVNRVSLFLSPKLKRRLTNNARRLAVDDARDSARMYAQELGATVGSLTHFADHTVAYSTDDGAPGGAPGGMMAASSSAARMRKVGTPVSLGQQSVSVTINVECSLYSTAASWLYKR